MGTSHPESVMAEVGIYCGELMVAMDTTVIALPSACHPPPRPAPKLVQAKTYFDPFVALFKLGLETVQEAK